MSDHKEVDPADSQNQASGSDSQNHETPPSPPKVDEKVSYETHRKLLDEKKKLQQKFEEALAKEKAREEADLRAKGNLEQLLKLREEELAKERERVSSYEGRFQTAKKLSAFMKTAGQSLDDKWLELVDLSGIAFKPDSEDVDEMSVVSTVEAFKAKWPEALKKMPHMPTVDAPGGIASMITESEWRKLKSKEMGKYKPNQIMWGK